MTTSQKLLVCSGLVLLIFAMSYGLWYAVFAEHQRLDKMGARLAASFAKAAVSDLQTSHAELGDYAEAKYLYVREVDAHSHWAGLAILLILFGAFFDRVRFTERTRSWLAAAFTASSFVFPFGVLLENFSHGLWPRVLATLAAGILIASMVMVAAGFMRSSGAQHE